MKKERRKRRKEGREERERKEGREEERKEGKKERKKERERKKRLLLTLLNSDGLITVFSDSAGCVQGSSGWWKRSAALSGAQPEY